MLTEIRCDLPQLLVVSDMLSVFSTKEKYVVAREVRAGQLTLQPLSKRPEAVNALSTYFEKT